MTVSCISYACCAAPCGFMVHQRRAAKASWYVWQNDPNLTLWSVDYSCVWRLFLKSGIDHLWVQMFVYRSRRWWGFRAHRKMAPGTRDPTSQQSEQLRRAENNFKRLCSSQRTRVTCRLAQMYAWNFCLWQSLCVPQKNLDISEWPLQHRQERFRENTVQRNVYTGWVRGCDGRFLQRIWGFPFWLYLHHIFTVPSICAFGAQQLALSHVIFLSRDFLGCP